MSNSTHRYIHFDVRAATSVTYLHLGEHSQVEADASPERRPLRQLNLGGGHRTGSGHGFCPRRRPFWTG